jgi:hypothetical protein
LALLTRNKGKLCKILIITLFFEKNANFFAKNCWKSQKIVIITSTPGQLFLTTNRNHKKNLSSVQLMCFRASDYFVFFNLTQKRERFPRVWIETGISSWSFIRLISFHQHSCAALTPQGGVHYLTGAMAARFCWAKLDLRMYLSTPPPKKKSRNDLEMYQSKNASLSLFCAVQHLHTRINLGTNLQSISSFVQTQSKCLVLKWFLKMVSTGLLIFFNLSWQLSPGLTPVSVFWS